MTVHGMRFAERHVDTEHDCPAASADERKAGLEVLRSITRH
jgi:hypothetical protein